MAAKIVPVRPAMAAPNMNARIFIRLTGMVITSAASESSRSARQARPVRDSFSRWRPTKTSVNTTSASQR